MFDLLTEMDCSLKFPVPPKKPRCEETGGFKPRFEETGGLGVPVLNEKVLAIFFVFTFCFYVFYSFVIFS